MLHAQSQFRFADLLFKRDFVHKETYIALVFDKDNSSLLYTRMIVMSLDVSIDNVLKKMINNLNWS